MKTKNLFILFLLCVLTPAYSQTIYFLVAEPNEPNSYSYILPLDEPNDIAHARDLITYGPSIGQPIVVAHIEPTGSCGNYDVNRHFAPWLWRVSSFTAFADSTPEILDGNPMMVNHNVDEWIAHTGGQIGFWNYTVVKELGDHIPTDDWRKDLYNDDSINFKDYAVLADSIENNLYSTDEDFNPDGIVDINDLGIFCSAWLSEYAQPPFTFTVWDRYIVNGKNPSSWCYPYHCQGDADGETQGTLTKVRIGSNDMTIFMSSWGKTVLTGADPAADFDHDGDVDDDDGAIINQNMGKKDSELNPCCPYGLRNCIP